MPALLKVVAGLLLKGGKLFLVKRPEGKEDGGLFEFPGGKVEEGETLISALKRELYEELGIKVKEAEFIGKEREKKGDFEVEINLFLIKEYAGELTLKEAEEGGFYTIEEALRLRLCPPDRRLIESLKSLKVC